ncbi:putative 20S rRNA accumulation protein 4 [Erysiphe neolycopersici]|uniref:Putative 20S rRNA accumulation protein 4 n=1 Tax=Erysiphe neolycopersici TaxID=212602 RepID=A0A420HX93_9PEZI|nr:putative 20S rRNA accumulation protein 4 [Erysiphe neolycopersici]
MAQSDSEFSDDENDDNTETNVLLGYASGVISDDEISHLGGQPQWIDSSTPPLATLVKCKICNNFMVLLLQLNGCLPEIFPGHDRRLYLWICRQNLCKRKDGSVRVLRGLQVLDDNNLMNNDDKSIYDESSTSSSQIEKVRSNLGETLFGTKDLSNIDGNPFSVGVKTPLNPFSSSNLKALNITAITTSPSPLSSSTQKNSLSKTFAESLSLNGKSIDNETKTPLATTEPWPPEYVFPSAFPTLYLVDSDYEILSIEEKKLPNHLDKMELEDEKESSQGNSREDKVIFESSIDETFQKFADRMNQNPEQVIRYEFNGQPLLYAKNDKIGKIFYDGGKEISKISTNTINSNKIPKCDNCGASRVFELQLTPYAISELEKGEDIVDGMEWGTIIVGVCSKDCQQKGVSNGVGYIEEWVGVQWEELK